jgi:hypothetical protein
MGVSIRARGSAALSILAASILFTLGAGSPAHAQLDCDDLDHDCHADRFTARGIVVHAGTGVLTETFLPAEGGVSIDIETKGGRQTLTAEKLLVAVGRGGVVEGIGLEGTGVELERGYVKVDGHMRTGEPGLYAIGDVIGGMLLGLSRKAATDFSFFLAIPTLIGAGGYSLYKERAALSVADVPLFSVGLVFSFLSAWLCVRWLLRYISVHSFIPFAWYRIAFGVVVLLTAHFGWVDWKN